MESKIWTIWTNFWILTPSKACFLKPRRRAQWRPGRSIRSSRWHGKNRIRETSWLNVLFCCQNPVTDSSLGFYIFLRGCRFRLIRTNLHNQNCETKYNIMIYKNIINFELELLKFAITSHNVQSCDAHTTTKTSYTIRQFAVTLMSDATSYMFVSFLTTLPPTVNFLIQNSNAIQKFKTYCRVGFFL